MAELALGCKVGVNVRITKTVGHSMGLSRRDHAAHRGVSETAVRKAFASGKVSVEANGTIDPAKADRDWSPQTDPAKQRGLQSIAPGTQTAASTARATPPGRLLKNFLPDAGTGT